jgi:hypothetical protein
MKPEAGWYPIALEQSPTDEIWLHWQNLSAASFNEPFFEDSLRRDGRRNSDTRKQPYHSLDPLPFPEAIPPTAFIFHTSRSGSTLLTQLLTCLDGVIALSEPPIIDEALQLPQTDEEKIILFQYLVSALGQRRSEKDRYFFLKHDSWHLSWLKLIRQAFPNTPCFFVYRHPVEILWSHHRQRGSQMVPGLRDLSLLGIDPNSFHPADLDGYAARVLESIFTSAFHHIQQGQLIPLVHHQLLQNPASIIERFGITPSTSENEKLKTRHQFHSKRPDEIYQPRVESMIPLEIRTRLEELASPVLWPIYEKLAALSPVRPSVISAAESQTAPRQGDFEGAG